MERCWNKFYPDILDLPKVCDSPPTTSFPTKWKECPYLKITKMIPATTKQDKISKRQQKLAENFYPKTQRHESCVPPLKFVPKHIGLVSDSVRKPGEMTKEVKLIIDKWKAKKAREEREKAEKLEQEKNEIEAVLAKRKIPEERTEVKQEEVVEKQADVTKARRKSLTPQRKKTPDCVKIDHCSPTKSKSSTVIIRKESKKKAKKKSKGGKKNKSKK